MNRVVPLLSALLGGLLLAAGWSAGRFAQSYLAAVAGWTALSLGALALLAANTLVGGRWGPATARTLLPAARIVPLAGLLLVPLLLAPDEVWPWARDGWQPDGPGKATWFDPRFFAGRTAAYVVAWSLIAWWLPPPGALPRRLPRAVVALGAHLVLSTLAGVDWLLSLEPGFNSSIFGLLFLAHQVAGALALAVLLSGTAAARLGALLLAAAIAWGYFAAMQYLVIWTADLPREAAWVLRRTEGGWEWASWAMIALLVALPVPLLMWRRIRLKRWPLAVVAAMVLVGDLLHAAWLAAPGEGLAAAGLAFAGVGMVWLAAFGLFRARLPPPPRA